MSMTKTFKKNNAQRRLTWAEVEPIYNLTKNTLGKSEAELADMIGVTVSGISGWRSRDFVPRMFPLALSQILHEHSPTSDGSAPPVIVGLRFTNDQLDLLYTGMTSYARTRKWEEESKKLLNEIRAALLHEMAHRLENSK
jgi:DNA-binding transcriptional regulator YiaG